MIQIEKEVERQKSKMERNKVVMERKILPSIEDYEEDSSTSYMSMYSLPYGEEFS